MGEGRYRGKKKNQEDDILHNHKERKQLVQKVQGERERC